MSLFFRSPTSSIPTKNGSPSSAPSPSSSPRKVGSIKNAAELRREASLLGAAKLNNVSEVNRLIRLGTNLDATSKGWTALAAAAGVGNHKVINALIRAGASVDAENDDGYTAVHAATEGGRIDTIELLHSLGADVDKTATNGKRPIIVAEDHSQTAVIELLEKLGVDYYQGTSAYVFAGEGRNDGLTALKKRGDDINELHHDGSSPVLAAAENGHIDTVRFLVEQHGADVSLANKKNQTPLVMSIYRKKAPVVCYLRGLGCSLGNEHLDVKTTEDVVNWMEITGLLVDFDADAISSSLTAWGVDGEKLLGVSTKSQMHQFMGGEDVLSLEWAAFWYEAATMHAIVQEDREHTRQAISLGSKALEVVDNPSARRLMGRLQRQVFSTYANVVSQSLLNGAHQSTAGTVTSTMAPILDELKRVATEEHARLASEATAKCLDKYLALSERWQMAMASMPFVPTMDDDYDMGPWVSIPMPKPSPRAIARSVLRDLKTTPRPTHPPTKLSWAPVGSAGLPMDRCPIGTGTADWVRSADEPLVNRLTHLSMVSRCWGGVFVKLIGNLIDKINAAETPQTLGLDYKTFACPFISNRNLLVDGTLRAKFTVTPQKSLKDALTSAKTYEKRMEKTSKCYPSSNNRGVVLSPADYVTDITSGVVDVENPYMVAVIFECLRDSTPGLRMAWCENNMAGESSEALCHSAATFKMMVVAPDNEERHKELGIPIPFDEKLAGKDMICATLRIHFAGFRHVETMADMYAKIASAEREQLPGLILADPLFLNPVTLEDEIPSVMKDLPEKSTSPGKTMGKMLLQAHKRGDLEKIADGM
jgi:ankyrin repeat protein